MKRRFMMFLIAFLFMFFISPISYAEEEPASQEEILSSQQDSLNISSFIKEAQKYTTDTFEDLDLGNLFSSAITGNVDNEMLLKAFSKIIGKEVVSCINVLGSIIYFSNHLLCTIYIDSYFDNEKLCRYFNYGKDKH